MISNKNNNTKRFEGFSPEKKLMLALELYNSAKKLKKESLKKFHPEWSESKINQKLKTIFLNARS
jgi:hypothetical protein